MKWFIFVMLTLIFLITPYQKGLYFSYNTYPIIILLTISCLFFILRLFIKDDSYLLKRYLVVLLLPLCYVFSFPFAESPKGTWDSILRWILYTSFFVLLLWTASKPKIKDFLALVFSILGAFLAFSMLLIYYGWMDYPSAIIVGRFGGVFQYPNTFGMLMALFFFYSLINLTEGKLAGKYLYLHSFLLVPFMVCFIQSYSRGMMLLFPFAWVLGLLLLPLQKQLKYVAYSFISIISSLVICQSILLGESVQSKYPGLLIFVLMIIITITLCTLINQGLTKNYEFFKKEVLTKGRRHLILPLIILVITLVGLLDLKNEGIIYKSLPDKLQDRLAGISLETGSATERFLFVDNALSMSQSSPFFGFGGEGWAAVYKQYQNSPYISNKIHNGYMEWIIDTGWIGFSIFLFVFLYFFYLLIKSYRIQKDSALPVAVIVALIILFSHSFIDFNFSFGSVWLIAFWLLAIGLSNTTTIKESPKKHYGSKSFIKITFGVYALLLLIGLIQSYKFMTARQMFEKANAAKSISVKEHYLTKSVSNDPKNIKYLTDLSLIYSTKFTASKDLIIQQQVKDTLKRMVETEPHNSTVLFHAAKLSEKAGLYDDALSYYNMGLSVDHFNAKLYQDSIALKVNTAMKNIENQNRSKADKLISSALEDYKKEIYWNAQVNKTNAGKAFNSRDFHITPATKDFISLAYFLKKDFRKAIEYSKKNNKNKNMKLTLIALQIISFEKIGEIEKSSKILHDNLPNYKDLTKVVGRLEILVN
ncbi:O-antigen polymerase [Neobacillus bataviensis LMG 21833]|uniref:O-antigen polymerase n=1 Tax=Neobacillus bataviensis LMG 21833 TaxID=1117379 RepID=K6DSV0_9BACI|nr:O-antigen ligase family protein [Neobacillus bataviensis]EKN71323.1 O-antigen polymerase [Neobacillus bataviensis LMG 21833]